MNGQFLLHKLNIPQSPQMMAPIRAAEILSRGMQLVQTRPFEWAVLDKPIEGSMFLFRTQPGQTDIGEDGYFFVNCSYGWLDNEQHQRIMLDNGMVF